MWISCKVLPTKAYRNIFFHDETFRLQTYILMNWIKIDFFGTRLRSWSFHFFCVTFFLLAYLSMHCEFLLRESYKPRWISTLNQKYLFVITSLTTTHFEYGLSFRRNQKNQGHHIKKSFGRQGSPRFKWFYEEEGEFEILTLASWFSHYSYSRTSIRSSMGGMAG